MLHLLVPQVETLMQVEMPLSGLEGVVAVRCILWVLEQVLLLHDT